MFELRKGLRLQRRENRGHGKPDVVTVLDSSPNDEHLIRLSHESGKLVMPKSKLFRIYELPVGRQSSMFKLKSRVDHLRAKYLKCPK